MNIPGILQPEGTDIIKREKTEEILWDLKPSGCSDLLEFVLKEDSAVSAELVRFSVHILQGAAVVHNAALLPAMAQVEGMAQFMDRLF